MPTMSWVAIVIAVGAMVLVTIPIVKIYRRFRGTRIVTCPETEKSVAVNVDAMRAALSSFDEIQLRLSDCTRWPEREDCGQECLRQIEEEPDDCLVRNMLQKWYEGKSCAVCGRALEKTEWLEHKPAVRATDGTTHLWSEFRAETIPEVMKSHTPVCWDCHIAESLRRTHPDRIVDRPWKSSAGKH